MWVTRRVHASKAYVALVIQHVTRIRHVVTSFVAPRSPCFSELSQAVQFSEKKIEFKFVLFFSTPFV